MTSRALVGALITAALILPSGAFAAETANLDSCANWAGAPLDQHVACGTAGPGGAWGGGALHQGNSRYLEGDAVPHRLVLGNLVAGTPSPVPLRYASPTGGAHGYDSLTSYDAAPEAAENTPCAGVACGAADTTAVPAAPAVTAQGGVLTLWNGH